MGLFDEIAGTLSGGSTGVGGQQALVTSILEMLGSQSGGLSGLAAAFQQKGLGDIVTTWIGTGENLPISENQIQQVLGSDQLQAIAGKAGIPAATAGRRLAALLPGIVDKLTPGGQIPESNNLMSTDMGHLKDLMSGGE